MLLYFTKQIFLLRLAASCLQFLHLYDLKFPALNPNNYLTAGKEEHGIQALSPAQSTRKEKGMNEKNKNVMKPLEEMNVIDDFLFAEIMADEENGLEVTISRY